MKKLLLLLLATSLWSCNKKVSSKTVGLSEAELSEKENKFLKDKERSLLTTEEIEELAKTPHAFYKDVGSTEWKTLSDTDYTHILNRNPILIQAKVSGLIQLLLNKLSEANPSNYDDIQKVSDDLKFTSNQELSFIKSSLAPNHLSPHYKSIVIYGDKNSDALESARVFDMTLIFARTRLAMWLLEQCDELSKQLSSKSLDANEKARYMDAFNLVEKESQDAIAKTQELRKETLVNFLEAKPWIAKD
ncbi:MAG: hypothetical protein R3A80_12255 [Bdellovibrionota bacterium]